MPKSQKPSHVDVPLTDGRRPLFLKNKWCAYCGVELNKKTATQDHVIGRNFVPKGKIGDGWYLVLNACGVCNNLKSNLEDDISAISMNFHRYGLDGMSDPLIQKEALRKIPRAISKKTGKPVIKSDQSVAFQMPQLSGLSISGSFSAPAQLEDERLHLLARYHLLAFFYFLTYKRELSRGHYWNGVLHFAHSAIKPDWGNPIHRYFTDSILDWHHRLTLNGAGGYFKVLIRKHPSISCWAWALERNDCYRLIGYFGDEDTIKELTTGVPPLMIFSSAQSNSSTIRLYEHVPLDPKDDVLFQMSNGI